MKLPLFFAKRYLFSKKSVNAINLISGISAVGVIVSSASLIAILSFYNGLETLILSMYSDVASEIRIEPAEGKFLYPQETAAFEDLASHQGIGTYQEVIEEKVLVEHDNSQVIATLKGVGDGYLELLKSDSSLFLPEFQLSRNGVPQAILGSGIDWSLGLSLSNNMERISVFAVRKGEAIPVNPAEEFNVRDIDVSGIIGNHEEFNDMILVPSDFARDVLDEYQGVSAIEINSRAGYSFNDLYTSLKQDLGSNFKVLSREEQNPTLYRIIRSEKWAIFSILTLTALIAILNIFGSLTMLVIDKKKDISVLKGLGAPPSLIRKIFFYQGMIIGVFGSLIGLLLGWLVCYSQVQWGWLKFSQAENMIVEAYPVDIRWQDFVLVFATILLVSTLISYFSSRLSVQQQTRLS